MQKTILVIDTFRSIRDFICESLNDKGYRATGVSNGSEAIDLITRQPESFDLIISDYEMTESPSIELWRKIRANKPTGKTEFIFLVSDATLEKAKKEKETKYFFWIKKPYQLDVLFSRIENIINNTSKANRGFQDIIPNTNLL